MKRFDDSLISFILNNIQIQDLAENFYGLEKNKKKSTKSYPVYNFLDYKIIVNAEKNTFFVSNYNAGGTVIDFVKYIENLDFVNAVKKIASYHDIKINNDENNINYSINNEVLKKIREYKEKKEKELKQIDEKAKKEINIYKNLKNNSNFEKDIRGISKNLLNYLKNNNYIKHYKNNKYDIIKIPLYKIDEAGKKEIVGIQDIYFSEKTNRWQKINKGRAGIFICGNLKNTEKLVFTEAAFDALSAYELSYNNKIKKNKFYNYSDLTNDLGVLATNGALSDLKRESIVNLLKNHNNITTLILAFDDDNQGKEYDNKIIELLKENNLLNNFNIVKITYDKYKDLNELLQAKKAKEKEIEQKQKHKNKELEIA